MLQSSDLEKILMTSQDTVLAPGPVNLHPEVRKILAEPMIHHRTPEFDKILKDTLKGLQFIFQTQEPVFMHTSTGSGGMESLLINPLSKGDEIIIINSGKFGERWVEMAKVYGAIIHEIKVPWGEAVTVSQVEQLIKKYPIKMVLTQACETSTAVLHPIKELGEFISQYPDILFLVDGITACGAVELPMDLWKIDGLVAGSQKALMLPTGLSFVSFSKKAWKKIENSDIPKFYFDIKKERKANEKGETWFSSAVPHIKALQFIIHHIQTIGYSQHLNKIKMRSELFLKWLPLLGFKVYAQSPSPSVSAFTVPDGVDSQKLRNHLEEKYRVTIMGGQDQAKGKIIRIGHMGYITKEDLLRTFAGLAYSLKELQKLKLNEIELLKIINDFEKEILPEMEF